MDLREKITDVVRQRLAESDGYIGPCAGVVREDGTETEVGWPLIDGTVDVETIADAILAIPEIAEALDCVALVRGDAPENRLGYGMKSDPEAVKRFVDGLPKG